MNTSITARELFDQQRDKLALRWVAGPKGEHREIQANSNNARRPSLAGYLNVIYPNKVQILGTEELAWLDSLDARQRWETIEKIIQVQPLALAISKNQSCPEDLRAAADESNTPLWISSSAATNCSTTSPTIWRARWRRGSPCMACSWRSTRSAC